MQIGTGLFPYSRFQDPADIATVVRAADELGYAAITLPEHLLPPRWERADPSARYWYDPAVLAAFIAAQTTRIRLLTSVTVIPYRHPVAAAKAFATLDHLSGGRLDIGVGAGWMEAEFRRLGLPFEERAAMTDEYLLAMCELWSSDAPRFEGRYVSFDHVSFEPRPIQQPHPPLYIGGTGPRPFRRVVEIGDGWFPMSGTLDEIAAGVVHLRREFERAGRDPDSLWVGAPGFSYGAGGDSQLAAMRHDAGGTGESRAIETPDDALAEIARQAAAGVTYLGVGFQWDTVTELVDKLAAFAREVLEHLPA